MPATALLDPASGVNERISLYTLFLSFYLLVHVVVAVTDRDANLLVTIAVVGVVFLGFPYAMHRIFSLLIEEAVEREQRRNNENLVRNDIDGVGGGRRHPGVTKEAKEHWKIYAWDAAAEDYGSRSNIERKSIPNYGSTSCLSIQEVEEGALADEGGQDRESASKLEDGLLPSEERPVCSICLCEYEAGEQVVRVPCGHIYHEPCLDLWTADHVRCPLCNCDFMEVTTASLPQ